MRVLYVEDNPANVFLVKRVAKIGNHEIINYVDGTEALSQFASINPDLVLMDIQITGELSGLDVVKKLRADGITTPIIAVTAYAMVGDRERCIEAGCTDYLAKPLPIPQLVQIFEHYSQNRFTTSELERLGTSKKEIAEPVQPTNTVPTEEKIAEKIGEVVVSEKFIEKTVEVTVPEKLPEPIIVIEEKNNVERGDVAKPKDRE